MEKNMSFNWTDLDEKFKGWSEMLKEGYILMTIQSIAAFFNLPTGPVNRLRMYIAVNDLSESMLDESQITNEIVDATKNVWHQIRKQIYDMSNGMIDVKLSCLYTYTPIPQSSPNDVNSATPTYKTLQMFDDYNPTTNG